MVPPSVDGAKNGNLINKFAATKHACCRRSPIVVSSIGNDLLFAVVYLQLRGANALLVVALIMRTIFYFGIVIETMLRFIIPSNHAIVKKHCAQGFVRSNVS